MPWAWVLGLALVLAAALVLAVFALRGAARSRRAVVRARRAVAGEAAGATLLEAHGYEILGVQVAASYPLVVDGAEARFGVRADYIVSRDGRRLVAEAKTGAVAPRLDHAPTRRQVLEYGVVRCDGVVLVVAEAAACSTKSPLAGWMVAARRPGVRSAGLRLLARSRSVRWSLRYDERVTSAEKLPRHRYGCQSWARGRCRAIARRARGHARWRDGDVVAAHVRGEVNTSRRSGQRPRSPST
ncbi:MAG: hypothetical protein U0235_04460 [Polyangiaceae bacterium]